MVVALASREDFLHKCTDRVIGAGSLCVGDLQASTSTCVSTSVCDSAGAFVVGVNPGLCGR